MPIFDQGYHHWQGKLAGHTWRWFAITRRGFLAQLKNRPVKILVLVGWLPALVLAAFLVLWGLLEQKSTLLTPFLSLISGLPEEIREGAKGYRTTIWTLAFSFFFQIQTTLAMVLVLLVGPDLISQDLRFNAIPLYLSKPIRRIDYFLGKLGVIGAYLVVVIIAPLLLAYLLGLAFSLDLSVFRDTIRLVLASLGYGAIVAVSAGTLMLAISSLSRNSRHIGGIWVGIWMLTGFLATVLVETVKQPWCPMVSYVTNLRRLNDALLDTRAAWLQIAELNDAVMKRARMQTPAAMFLPQSRTAGRRPPAPPDRAAARRERPMRRRASTLEEMTKEPYPWEWSAGALVGLFGFSAFILSQRVKSLDKLR